MPKISLPGTVEEQAAQIYDMAAEAMQGFQAFMVFPDNLDDILARLEQVRERVYN